MISWVSEAESHLKRDPVLANIIKRVGHCTLKSRKGHYKQLVRSIISQQISVSAAKSIRKRLFKKANKPHEILQLKPKDFRLIGLSIQKVSYIVDLSSKIHKKEVKLHKFSKQEDEQIIEELIKIRGIGRWTAEMFLIFSLNRPDVMPYDDLGIKRAIMINYKMKFLPDRRKMEKISRAWKPYRTIACWYLWKSIE